MSPSVQRFPRWPRGWSAGWCVVRFEGLGSAHHAREAVESVRVESYRNDPRRAEQSHLLDKAHARLELYELIDVA
jgi:hypothetical protein